ncbi:DNA replication protein [Neobacillus mesonae]|uniref:DNA replication protein n=1 Tax=Neobacillus mesonae TaxID=1193713 RepID=A0A3Q9QXH7_9BACI|nr:DNA replication protein [Neobacillus mesonae]AZU61017.1 DNA replication protein [Neobacillus mesonae]
MTHASNCILNARCKLANTDACNRSCSHYIALHGYSGKGGRMANAGTPADYRLLTLANSPARESQAKTYATLEKFCATFERQFEAGADRIKSLYLWSDSPGTGKTTTAVAILNEWITAHYLGSLRRDRQPLQTPAVFLDVNAFQTDYNLATMTNDDAAMANIKSTILRTQHAPFAVLDDIGVRSASEAFRSYVHAIVNYRTANGLPTVFTSNLPIEEMAVVFDARLYDRMRDMCAVLHFAGESKRGRR